jgi:acyl phosphate:glycerol-3-phosphate acyltransferase
VAATPVWMGLIGQGQGIALTVALAALVWIMHRANIARLLAGSEPRIGRKA